VEQRGYGLAVPLHVVHSAGGAPVVGTSLEYLEQRGLELARGRTPALLAEVLAGAQVADEFALSVGDAVRSDLNNLYNLAGSYPVLLEVVGILQPSGTSDDEVFFCDVKTAWVLDGSLHGHDEVTRDNALNLDSAADSVAAGQPQRRVPTGAPEGSGSRTEPDNLEASPAMFVFSELTSANRSSFHFHGDPGVLPVTSVLVFPRDPRAFDQLLGDFVLDEDYQAVEPATVIRTILGIVLRVRDGLVAWFGLVAFSTVCFFVLVLSLSLRLRAAELALMKRIGCSRSTVTTVVGVEVAIILGASVLSAAVLTRVGLIFVRAVTGG
jgi:putative ABC transport system permease protein